MNLTINVDALDKTASAVVSASDRTPVDSLEDLTVGNVEPIAIAFCDSTGATPAWVADAGTTVSVGLGRPAVDGGQSYASATLAIGGVGRTGTLDLTSATMRGAAYNPWGYPRPGRRGVFLTLEVRRVTVSGVTTTAAETLALLEVFCPLPVLA